MIQPVTPILTTRSDVDKFTGKERDYESNLDNFIARFDSSQFGRFLSPDPDNAGASDGSPQTWNAYAYAIDNPMDNVDPDGRAACDTSTAGGGCVEVTANGPDDEVTYSYTSKRIMLRQLGDAAQRANDYLRYAWDWWRTSRVDSGCVAAATAAGAAFGASQGPVVGGVLGLAGGPVAEATVPGGIALGAAVGGTAGGGIGTGVGWIVCRVGAPGGGGSGSGGSSSGGNLSGKARKKLGNLVDRAGDKVRDVIRSRGGTASNVNQAGPWADKTLGETAQAAANGDESAETAIKIAKQASRLGEKY